MNKVYENGLDAHVTQAANRYVASLDKFMHEHAMRAPRVSLCEVATFALIYFTACRVRGIRLG